MFERDRYGVRIFPEVAGIGSDKAVKITRFDAGRFFYGMKPDEDRLRKLKYAYSAQAQELSEKAFASGISFLDSARMLGKAAYSMRQASEIALKLKFKESFRREIKKHENMENKEK